ncbi:hypothetical protein [Halomonas piscis]|uniref:hypothetical protein n=1 Tax=Halomonas piscis TaxID=3031727 RepID=UPI002899114C|nr:hypothetical protein [Halomonas piscis]
MKSDLEQQRANDIAREKAAERLFEQFIEDNAEELKLIAHWGDGHGGYMLHVIQEKLGVKP